MVMSHARYILCHFILSLANFSYFLNANMWHNLSCTTIAFCFSSAFTNSEHAKLLSMYLRSLKVVMTPNFQS